MRRDDRFGSGPLGFGLRLPKIRGGWTEDLAFSGSGVAHIRASEQSAWQVKGKYSIEDRYNEGFVFVPTTPGCACKLFRVQHDSVDPSHALVHANVTDDVILVPLRPNRVGEEITFDYFAGACDDGKAGSGYHHTQMDWKALEGRAMYAASQPYVKTGLSFDLHEGSGSVSLSGGSVSPSGALSVSRSVEDEEEAGLSFTFAQTH